MSLGRSQLTSDAPFFGGPGNGSAPATAAAAVAAATAVVATDLTESIPADNDDECEVGHSDSRDETPSCMSNGGSGDGDPLQPTIKHENGAYFREFLPRDGTSAEGVIGSGSGSDGGGSGSGVGSAEHGSGGTVRSHGGGGPPAITAIKYDRYFDQPVSTEEEPSAGKGAEAVAATHSATESYADDEMDGTNNVSIRVSAVTAETAGNPAVEAGRLKHSSNGSSKTATASEVICWSPGRSPSRSDDSSRTPAGRPQSLAASLGSSVTAYTEVDSSSTSPFRTRSVSPFRFAPRRHRSESSNR